MGYLRNPGKTASEFTDNGWLKSGDIGYIDKVNNICNATIVLCTSLFIYLKFKYIVKYIMPPCLGLSLS